MTSSRQARQRPMQDSGTPRSKCFEPFLSTKTPRLREEMMLRLQQLFRFASTKNVALSKDSIATSVIRISQLGQGIPQGKPALVQIIEFRLDPQNGFDASLMNFP
jgi:hypothetical protein